MSINNSAEDKYASSTNLLHPGDDPRESGLAVEDNFTPAPVRADPASVRTMVFTMLLMSIGFSIVFPSLNLYMKKAEGEYLYGWTVASYSFGQLLASPLLGYLSNSLPIREIMSVSLIINAIGNITYSAFQVPWVILLSRFIVGLGAGNISVIRAYGSYATPLGAERTSLNAKLSAAQGLGFIIGPAVGAVFVGVDFNIGSYNVNKLTIPGFVSGLVGAINIALFYIYFKEVSVPKKGYFDKKSSVQAYIPIAVCIFVFFVIISNFAVLETLATPVTRDNYHWDVLENGILFAGAGIVGVIVFLSIKPLSKYMNDRVLLIVGCLIMAVGFIISSEFNGKMSLAQFIVGSFFISVGYPIGQVMVYAVYAKVLGSATQGALMGWLTGFGAVARTLGPIWSSFGYERAAEVGEEIVFLICAGLAILAAIAVILAYSKLVTPSYGQLQDEDDAES